MARIALMLVRLAVGGIFVYAGASKIGSPAGFGDAIRHYDLVAWPWALVGISVLLPWIEIVAGLAVVVRRLHPGGLVVLAMLCVGFTLALVSARWRGLDIHCGCFGHGDASVQRDFLVLLGRDLALLAGILVLLVRDSRPRPATPAPPAPEP